MGFRIAIGHHIQQGNIAVRAGNRRNARKSRWSSLPLPEMMGLEIYYSKYISGEFNGFGRSGPAKCKFLRSIGPAGEEFCDEIKQ